MSQHIYNINQINAEEIHNSSNAISEKNLYKIQSIILGLENNSFKQIEVKKEIECFYSQINNCSIKERLVLTTLINISKSSKNIINSKYLSYNDIIQNNSQEKNDNIFDNEDELNLDNRIFVAVERVAHKTLHKSQIINGKNKKLCSIYNDIDSMEFKETDNINYNNIDKLINNLKKKENHEHLEFIAIKAIIIGIINLTQELINEYLKSGEDININFNILNEDYLFSEDDDIDENKIIILKPYIFETIFNDYVFTSNMCPFLENYFIESFNNFRNKYKIAFTLTELFTDIFWNCIFHNKILNNKFINICIGNDCGSEKIRGILNKIIKIISDISIPLKSQIFSILTLNNIENEDDIDLMTSIIIQKNINRNLIKSENIINNVNRTSINAEYINILNNDKKDDFTENKNDNKEEEKKLDNSINEDNLENKTVDEVFNFINDNNKEIKSKKKKRTKKKKNKKTENEIKALNENDNNKDNEDDIIFQKFKEDIEKNVIDANEINKVKPKVPDSWVKMISNY